MEIKSAGALLDELQREFPEFGLAIYQYDPREPTKVELYRGSDAGDLFTSPLFSVDGPDLQFALERLLEKVRAEFGPNIFG